MRHTKASVIKRTEREFAKLDKLVGGLSAKDWKRPLPRPEGKEAWTVKDALAHITHWKAGVARKARKQPVPADEQGLNETESNDLIYRRWRDRPAKEVLAWHRAVHTDVLAAFNEAPDKWFNGRERKEAWPFDVDGHSE